MTIRLIIDGDSVPVKHVRFSDEGSTIQIQSDKEYLGDSLHYYSVTVDPETAVDAYITELLLFKSALQYRFPNVVWDRQNISLPYLPYGRADRVFEKGNPLPIEMFFEALQTNFPKATVCLKDPHSKVYEKFDMDIRAVSQLHALQDAGVHKLIKTGDVLVSPDEGAKDKIKDVRYYLYTVRNVDTTLITAGKRRDIETGRVVETTLPLDANVEGKVCWIIDDIADGGGTFIPLAEALRKAGAIAVNLYVTHGIFAKGLDCFKGVLDGIYVNQIVRNYIAQEDLKQFNATKVVAG